jgi:solute carrier family 25 (mitochondrial carnitine/acylcarnitine transporter), member 20/29
MIRVSVVDKANAGMRDFVAGCAGGISVVVVSHPLDLVKVRVQSAAGTPWAYPNSYQCARHIYNRQGLIGFYNGLSAPLAAIGFCYGARFGVFGMMARYLTEINHADENNAEALSRGLQGHLKNDTNLEMWENCVCASTAAVAAVTVMTPFDTVKVRLQTEYQFDHRKYHGMVHCMKTLYAEGGMRKLYIGWSATMMRDVPGTVAYFGAYGHIISWLPPTQEEFQYLNVLLAGGLAGCAQWTITFPMDTAKTRIQSARSGTYGGWRHALRDIYKSQGVMGFYPGLRPALIRAFFLNACVFAGTQVTLDFIARVYGPLAP